MTIKSSEITSKSDFLSRRRFLSGMVASSLGWSNNALSLTQPSGIGEPILGLKQSAIGRNLEPTAWEHVTSYNNFYELGTSKSHPSRFAEYLTTENWSIMVSGLCNKPGKINLEDILSKFPQEERIYRFRCVEAWSMVIPWAGFSLSELLKKFDPKTNAKYVKFTTLLDREKLPGQKRTVLDWPYVEGLRIDEAMHPLTMMATGLYGEALLGQNGAPVRLVVPWKYGFKSIKSIVKIEFVERMPTSTWMEMAPREYGFYANVNPEVDHPRWSQAKHRVIGAGIFAGKEETLPFNGYAKEVAHLYKGMSLRQYF